MIWLGYAKITGRAIHPKPSTYMDDSMIVDDSRLLRTLAKVLQIERDFDSRSSNVFIALSQGSSHNWRDWTSTRARCWSWLRLEVWSIRFGHGVWDLVDSAVSPAVHLPDAFQLAEGVIISDPFEGRGCQKIWLSGLHGLSSQKKLFVVPFWLTWFFPGPECWFSVGECSQQRTWCTWHARC